MKVYRNKTKLVKEEVNVGQSLVIESEVKGIIENAVWAVLDNYPDNDNIDYTKEIIKEVKLTFGELYDILNKNALVDFIDDCVDRFAV